MDKEQRAALRKLAEEATPGPWVCKSHTCETIDDIDPGDDWTVYGVNGQCVCFESVGRNDCAQSNAKHIAAANPSTILAMLDYIETLEKDAGRYRWLRDEENSLTEDDPCVSDSFFNSWYGEELDKVIDEMIERNSAMQGETR